MKAFVGAIGVVMGLSLGLAGCSSDASEEDDGGLTIDREEVPEGRFKPASLEKAINDMVDAIEDTEDASNDVEFGVVLKELTGFWRPVRAGADRAIAELGVIGSVKGTTVDSLEVEEQVEEQIEFVEEQIEDGVKGLAIAPHNQDLIDVLDEFSDTGAPIVTIDSDLEDIERDIYIGTNNAAGGKTGGETLLDALDEDEGLVLVLGNTDPSWVGGFERTNEAADVLEDAGYTVQILNSRWVPEDEVDQIVEAVEDADEDVVGMLGVFANAFNLAAAAEDLEMDPMPTIVAFDFEPDTLSYMEDEVIAATHVQRQYYMGYMSVYTLFSIHTIGLKATKDILEDLLIDGYHLDTGLDVIGAGDLDEYNDFLKDLGI